jgi:hypothetical protein
MKKKIALMLSVVMLLSLLPMNVFGTASKINPAGVATVGINSNTTFDLSFTGIDNSGTATSAVALISLDNDAKFDTFAFKSGAAGVSVDKMSDTQFWIYVGPGVNASAFVLTASIDIPDKRSTTFSFSIEDLQGGLFASQTTAYARTLAAPGLNISVDSRIATDVFRPGDITIAETVSGMLKADIEYFVEIKLADGPSKNFYTLANSGTFKDATNLGTVAQTGGTVTAGVLTASFTPASESRLGQLGSIKLQDLIINAGEFAPRTGEISITVQVYWWNEDDLDDDGNPKRANIGDAVTRKVIDRQLRGVVFDAQNEAEVRSGNIGARTARFIISEDSPDSWNARDTVLQFPDGVTVASVRYIANWANWNDGDFDKAATLANGGGRVNGILVRDDQISIQPPTNATGRHTIIVDVLLSIEAGFTAADGSRDIVAEIVRGDDNFKADKVKLATVVDPISIKIDGLADGLVGNVNTTFDITIGEAAAGVLGSGSELWVYVVGTDRDEVSLSMGRRDVVTNAATGLRAEYAGLRSTDNSSIRNNAIVIDIETASWEASEILLRGVQINGVLQAGVDYYLVVSGNSVLSNNEEVKIDSLTSESEESERDILRNSLYFDKAFQVALATTVEEEAPPDATDPETDPDDGTEPGDTTGPGTDPGDTTEPGDTPSLINPDVVAPYTFETGQLYGDAPVFEVMDDPHGIGTSYIMATALAGIIGFDHFWDANLAEGTWTGFNAYNEEVVIKMRNGDDTMNVSFDGGATFDTVGIFSSSGQVPARLEYNRFYVPVKAFEEILGIVVTWDPVGPKVHIN